MQRIVNYYPLLLSHAVLLDNLIICILNVNCPITRERLCGRAVTHIYNITHSYVIQLPAYIYFLTKISTSSADSSRKSLAAAEVIIFSKALLVSALKTADLYNRLLHQRKRLILENFIPWMILFKEPYEESSLPRLPAIRQRQTDSSNAGRLATGLN